MATTHRLELEIPGDVFAKLERAAEQEHRSVQDEAVRLLTRVVPEDQLLPARTRAALANLATLKGPDLLRAARKRPSTRSIGLWRKLLAKREDEGLSSDDEHALDELEEAFYRISLIRAEAAVLLKERGYDISPVDAHT
ncbi:MAG: hypothetical protein ACRDJE_21285 [Dehalococcoidia bacterium]